MNGLAKASTNERMHIPIHTYIQSKVKESLLDIVINKKHEQFTYPYNFLELS